jgi:hypothetical protein
MPTLCGAVIAFEGFMQSLKDLQMALQDERIDVGGIIEMGLAKLEQYYNLTTDILANCFAMSE